LLLAGRSGVKSLDRLSALFRAGSNLARHRLTGFGEANAGCSLWSAFFEDSEELFSGQGLWARHCISSHFPRWLHKGVRVATRRAVPTHSAQSSSLSTPKVKVLCMFLRRLRPARRPSCGLAVPRTPQVTLRRASHVFVVGARPHHHLVAPFPAVRGATSENWGG
jgi:hypothetical protein